MKMYYFGLKSSNVRVQHRVDRSALPHGPRFAPNNFQGTVMVMPPLGILLRDGTFVALWQPHRQNRDVDAEIRLSPRKLTYVLLYTPGVAGLEVLDKVRDPHSGRTAVRRMVRRMIQPSLIGLSFDLPSLL